MTEANKLYKAAVYSGRAAPSDLLAGVYLDTELISVARIQINPEYGLIRHICTLPLLRQQGYGAHVVYHATDLWQRQHASIPLYLLPLPHLNDWYQRLGFMPIADNDLPDALRKIVLQSRRRHKGLTAMYIQPSAR
ncbi:MAG: GNAT family N-acetyltransferase [Thalassolituus sp.]|uniref:GNAT family N-acetyltransferase n=1 Tax=Thalassolituus sp. TaxID=2030822 RepID=UPI000BCDF490|nr:MAG: hypothetical protein COB43_12025 [Oceanospirillales bacterium]PHQ83463.1 MAG: hypothetical protein COB58_14075 [Thalassobium sp.]PHQ87491.1 MAG: hypothetical protein COB58_04355 [Thalassobium sp.]